MENEFNILQFNADQMLQYTKDNNFNIILLQEPYKKTSAPTRYNIIKYLLKAKAAIIIKSSIKEVQIITQLSDNNTIAISIQNHTKINMTIQESQQTID